ncbi:MAG: phage Gp37/Gp68 family protein [Aquabacterium sp.]|uniref:phage Gp37/Gp68 family protein n=1 Tax=Aquabacterium sp. TaxID=1872578 RepID=UPI0027175745|nr:phage Gp37/Gp68 family protein [Aquabacterium sp.]MDO9006318.1 phage Gp37/Gp68 family protein [Aquabacterium sp.]
MADKSLIEWTDATRNPITGCTLVDDGCRHCYAAHLITSWHAIGDHPSRKGLARKNAAGESKFTGEVRFNEGWLDHPLRWKKPRRIFVCAHGDLFHPNVPDEWIDKVFAVMVLAPQHTFQVLTKRPERAREYLSALHCGDGFRPYIRRPGWEANDRRDGDKLFLLAEGQSWPLRNVWLGTSISDQASADLRIPHLLACPAAIRFISAEPLLGEVDLEQAWHGENALDSECWGECAWCEKGYPALHNCQRGKGDWKRDRSGLDWVICGGESGPHARPMHPDWARSLRDQCVAAGVPFLFKQWGEWAPDDHFTHFPDPVTSRGMHEWFEADNSTVESHSWRYGKKRAGRLLDGVEWSQFPEVAA